MKTTFILTILFLLVSNISIAQVTTDPTMPVASKKVTITFDATQGTAGLKDYTGDVYAHSGVITDKSQTTSDWKYVLAAWNTNIEKAKLIRIGTNLYSLEITPDIRSFYGVPNGEIIKKLAFVFRSSDGSKEGKATGGKDIFLDVYAEGLAIGISTPTNNTILKKNIETSITASASEDATLTLSVNDTQIAQTTGKTISAKYTFTETGYKWLIAKAIAGGKTVYDSVSVYIKGDVVVQTKPATYKKGINYTSDQSAALVLWAPGKEFVYAIGDFNDWKLNEAYQMKKDGDYFWIELTDLTKGKQTVFQYYIDGKIKIADPYCEQISDPWNDNKISALTYLGLVAYPEGKTEGIASVLQTGQSNYEWQKTSFTPPSKEKLVIYELLVRDFTAEHTYQAVREKLDYLKDLNITALELMPVNEFEGNSSWGYNPSFYFAPDKYYGPKNELKKLIDECHKRGIAVIIDLVLNHSYGQSPFVKMYWDVANNRPAANNPWYNQQHNFQNTAAQWGYDFNHESIYTRQLVDSINSFWMSEYKVDGFRFDFTKGFSNTVYGSSSWGSDYDATRIANLKRMATEIWKRKPGAIVICEHLAVNSEEKELAAHGILLWGNMNGKYGEAAMGYNENGKSDLSDGIFSKREWTSPNLVSYMESHDEERLMYKNIQYGNSSGSYNIKQIPTALDRMELNSVFFLPLPGPKMIWQFGELGYDYSIDSNGGRLNEKTIRWDYAEMKDRTDLFRVMAKLNHLKKTYDEFSSNNIQYDLGGAIKTYRLNSGQNYVIAVGNFGISAASTTVTFPLTGNWYDYFSRSNYNVTSTSMTISLQPGEYKLFTSRELEVPKIVTSINDPVGLPKTVSVYPNPCGNFLQVHSSAEIKNIRIYGLDGGLKKVVPVFGTSTIINTGELPSGIYILEFPEEIMGPVKFVKQ